MAAPLSGLTMRASVDDVQETGEMRSLQNRLRRRGQWGGGKLGNTGPGCQVEKVF